MRFKEAYASWYHALVQVTTALDAVTPTDQGTSPLSYDPALPCAFVIACVLDYRRENSAKR